MLRWAQPRKKWCLVNLDLPVITVDESIGTFFNYSEVEKEQQSGGCGTSNKEFKVLIILQPCQCQPHLVLADRTLALRPHIVKLLDMVATSANPNVESQ